MMKYWNIEISEDISIRVNVNNETEYHTYIDLYNNKTMVPYSINTITLKKYYHPIILPNSLTNLNISGSFDYLLYYQKV